MALPRSMPTESEYNEKSCPRRCSEQYNPICGVNEAGDNCVFVNDCYMAMENCNVAAEKGEFNQMMQWNRIEAPRIRRIYLNKILNRLCQ